MKPNVIWIFGDQHRAQATGYMGDPNARTPNIDRMAAQGVPFYHAISGCPWCTPFRGALMTSRYVHRAVQKTPQELDITLPTIADAFNDAGYTTGYIGKWHLTGSNKLIHVPKENRGRFDLWLGYENNNAQYNCWIHGHDQDGRDDTDPLAEKLEIYETDALTNRFIDFIKKQKGGNPFFGVLSVQPPHDPYVAPPEYEKNYSPESIQMRPNVPDIPRVKDPARKDLAGYYAQIENLDYNLGRILDTLEEEGLSDNTHVIFFSDHGDSHGSHGHFRKSNPYEEAVRIPCIVLPAGGKRVQEHSNAPFNHVDFAPTSLGLCGIDVPDWMEGTDFSHHVIPNRPTPKTEPTSAYIQQCVRKRFQSLNRTWRGIRTNDGWKYVCLEGQPLVMFDLNEDPYETLNLAFLDTHNEKREELQKELANWIEKTGDTFALPEV
jgi:arylsulfatase A-like enzyme